MGIAQPLADDDAFAVMGFGGEGKQPAGGQHAGGLRENRREFGDVHHGIRGQNEIRAGVRPRAQTLQHVGDFKLGVEAGGARPLDHARRQIDADEMIDRAGKGGRREPGAAAEIDGALEKRRLAARPIAPTAPP